MANNNHNRNSLGPLFEIHEYNGHKDLVFRSNPFDSREKILEIRFPYTEQIGKRTISVRLGSSNASVPPKPYIRTVGEVIENSQAE